MSLLIQGMKMPKNCLNCDLFYYKDMRETDFSFPRWPCEPWECYNVCVFQGHKKVDIRFRPDGCPLVPVPPYGDLIDRDALKEAFCGNCFADEKPMECFEPCMDMRIILDAPTIIEA